jgi:hypothetical protein
MVLFLPFCFQNIQKSVTHTIIMEKENKMIETLKIYGMKNISYSISIIISEVIMSSLSSILMIIVLLYMEVGQNL